MIIMYFIKKMLLFDEHNALIESNALDPISKALMRRGTSEHLSEMECSLTWLECFV